jgi:hypothetical protein
MAGEKWDGRQLFDGKLMVQPGYTFDGSEGGVAWMGKLSRCLITNVLSSGDILEWAERQDKEAVS